MNIKNNCEHLNVHTYSLFQSIKWIVYNNSYQRFGQLNKSAITIEFYI